MPLNISKRLFSSSCRQFSHPQRCLPASYYRGGTSRALIFHGEVLPLDKEKWPAIFRAALGSPDEHGRQLDGLGGGISSLSKVCIVTPPRTDAHRAIADAIFTMVAVNVKDGKVDFSSNCGNMTAAIGPWAWDHGFIELDEAKERASGMRTVRILNTNTGKIIRSTFEVVDGDLKSDGDLEIAGVAGTATPIQLDFLDPAGSKTGKLLPTGNAIDVIEGIPTSCVDAGNPCVFVKAADLGADGRILPAQFDNDAPLREKLERIRQAAALKMGVATSAADMPSAIPKICMVSEPATADLLSGAAIRADQMDLLARAVSMENPHRAIPITVALCMAVAARIDGSVVHQCLTAQPVDPKGITIAHPSGTIMVSAEFDQDGAVKHATLFRTARRLMEGTVFWRV